MIERLSSERAPKAVGSYSAASAFEGLIFTSGQLPLVPETGEFLGDTIELQTKQSMENIKAILEDNGSSMDQIIKSTVYLADINDFVAFDSVYKTYFDASYPSRSAFEVGNLPRNARVEIEVIALRNEK